MYSMGVSGFKAIFGGFVMHFFFADSMARSIGWASGSPFQAEVAFFNLAVGILGALTFFRRDFWLPYIIVSTVMGWGAGFVHLTELISQGNLAGNNAGPILYADLLMPILRIGLYVVYRHGVAQRHKLPDTSGAVQSEPERTRLKGKKPHGEGGAVRRP